MFIDSALPEKALAPFFLLHTQTLNKYRDALLSRAMHRHRKVQGGGSTVGATDGMTRQLEVCATEGSAPSSFFSCVVCVPPLSCLERGTFQKAISLPSVFRNRLMIRRL